MYARAGLLGVALSARRDLLLKNYYYFLLPWSTGGEASGAVYLTGTAPSGDHSTQSMVSASTVRSTNTTDIDPHLQPTSLSTNRYYVQYSKSIQEFKMRNYGL